MMSAARPHPDLRCPWALLALVVAAGLFAWWGTWCGAFLFDDHPAFENAAMLAGDWWRAAFAPPHQPFAGRPFTTLTLALDRALFGAGPFGPHLGNLVLHLATACLVLLLARRMLLAPTLGGRFAAAAATRLATAIALWWVVHPLATDAVAYATQRSTLLFGACLLGSLYALARGWTVAAVAAMASGMAAKEDMVAGPVLALAFGHAFGPRAAAPRRARWGTFGALAATWLVLLACVAAAPPNHTVGYATNPRLGPVDWLCTQAGVVLHYLRLAVWPSPLRGAYDWDYVRSLGPAVAPGLAVLAVLVVTALAWPKRPWWAWLGLWLFLLLAPTSTVLPIRSEVVAERRMYLPMLAVLVPTVLLVDRLLANVRSLPLRVAPVAAVALALALTTRAHLAVYRDEPSFWADAFARRTVGSTSHLAAQILGNHATMLRQQGRWAEAMPLYDEMMQCEAVTTAQQRQYAVSLAERGRGDEALPVFERIAAAEPGDAEAQAFYGISLVVQATANQKPAPDDPRLARAEQVLRGALALDGGRSDAWNSLGFVLVAQQRWQDAEAAYARVTELSTARVEPFLQRAELLARLGRKQEIGPLFERLLQDPRHGAIAEELRRKAAALSR